MYNPKYANHPDRRTISLLLVSLDYGEPPHIHVRREKMVAKFWLDPIVLERAGGFKPKEPNQIAALVQENQQLFLDK